MNRLALLPPDIQRELWRYVYCDVIKELQCMPMWDRINLDRLTHVDIPSWWWISRLSSGSIDWICSENMGYSYQSFADRHTAAYLKCWTLCFSALKPTTPSSRYPAIKLQQAVGFTLPGGVNCFRPVTPRKI